MNNYYLLGYPIAQSLSPSMHNLSFRTRKIDAHYGLREATEETASAVVSELIAEGAAGWNCTMPVKQVMATLCDELSDAARISGSVNTVKNIDGRLFGHTTDGIGFMKAAENCGYPLAGKKMTLLGTGGAAAAILIQAALDGVAEIAVFWNRPESKRRIEEMAGRLKDYSETRILTFSYSDPEDLKHQIADSTALVNATNVGMGSTFASGNCLIPDASFLRPELFVYDIIYHPAETPLLAMAKERGCTCENGLSMLIGQGAEAFRIWTGQEMPIGEVRKLLLNS